MIRKTLSLAAYIGFPLVALLFLTTAAWRQQDLDYNLTDAIGRRDIPQIRQYLEAGANPNAQWSDYGWRWKIRMMLHPSENSFQYTVMDRVKGDEEMEKVMSCYLKRSR